MSDYIKYNNFKEKDEHYNLSIEELNKKYKDDIINNKITQEIFDEIVNTIIEYEDTIKSIIKYRIKNIFISIISIKYIDINGPKDIGKVYSLIENINFLLYNELLSYNGILKTDYYDLENLCNEVYYDLKNNIIYGKYLSNVIDEDFKYINLLNIEYHLSNFKKYGSTDKEFVDFINKIIGG